MAKAVKATKPPTKTEILTNIAAATDLTKQQVASVLDALAAEIKKSLSSRGPGAFAIPGLLKIEKKRVPARKARKNVPNPFNPMAEIKFSVPHEGRVSLRVYDIAGRLAGEVLQMIRPHVKAGITTNELDRLCHDYIVNEQKAIPAPLNYHGFPKSICTSVNHQICHGIPSEKKLKKGDIINIDITVSQCVLKTFKYSVQGGMLNKLVNRDFIRHGLNTGAQTEHRYK